MVTGLLALRPAPRTDGLRSPGLVTAAVALVLALVVARYPVLAPPGLTLAARRPRRTTMAFLAVGIGLNVPLILYYNWFAHHAFRGKLPITARSNAEPSDDHSKPWPAPPPAQCAGWHPYGADRRRQSSAACSATSSARACSPATRGTTPVCSASLGHAPHRADRRLAWIIDERRMHDDD